MTTSVAMCTYNGARFIEEQLRSILNQTKLVGEIIVCDDGSTDKTVNIIQKIAEETTIPIRIYINETNLGCVQNFEKAIHLCQGDLIFLSDQDDIWLPEKVEIIVDWFNKNLNKDVVFGNAFLIDEYGDIIMKSSVSDRYKQNDSPFYLWDSIGFSELSQKQFDMGFALELWARGNRATGATMAVKRDFAVNAFSKRVDKEIYHDSQLCIEALLNDSLGYYTTPLTFYRIHSSQQIGCVLRLPIPKGWDDVRYASMDVHYYLPSIKNQNQQKRAYFIKERYRLQHSKLNLLFKFITSYKSIYEKKWSYLFLFDVYKSFRHTLKSFIKSEK